MYLLAVLADSDPAFWAPLVEKWGFATVALVVIGWWGHKQIERLIDSHVELIRVLSKNVVETREDVGETKKFARRILRHIRPGSTPDEEDEG